jgi:HEAT repeat protein
MAAGGCVPIPKGFDSPEPAARIEAAVEAADRGDRGAIPDLIALLESDDPATRLVAIRSLERLTGETLGYDHAAGEYEREEAVERWVEWHEQTADG